MICDGTNLTKTGASRREAPKAEMERLWEETARQWEEKKGELEERRDKKIQNNFRNEDALGWRTQAKHNKNGGQIQESDQIRQDGKKKVFSF